MKPSSPWRPNSPRNADNRVSVMRLSLSRPCRLPIHTLFAVHAECAWLGKRNDNFPPNTESLCCSAQRPGAPRHEGDAPDPDGYQIGLRPMSAPIAKSQFAFELPNLTYIDASLEEPNLRVA